jgi:predicted secreted protein
MRKLAISVVGIMAIITLEAAGCSLFNRVATYTEADTSITTSMDQEFIIALHNPSPRLGNRWYESYDDTMLSLVDTEYTPDDKSHPDFGGTQNYRFRSLKEGKTEASFTYKTATDRVIRQKVFSIEIKSE